jgi:hypothetical protein
MIVDSPYQSDEISVWDEECLNFLGKQYILGAAFFVHE